MDKLIIGILVIWGILWLLGIVLRVLPNLANAVRQEWDRTRPRREQAGYSIADPMRVVAATIDDHRLMSMGLAITLVVAALLLAGADSAALVSFIDAIARKDFPLLGWAIFGGVAGITMGIGSRALELGWFNAASISRVPDIVHLREGEEAAGQYFRIRSVAAVGGAVILAFALSLSSLRQSGYDPRTDATTKTVAIAAAGADGKVALLNAALEDSTSLLQSDPQSGIKILAALKALSIDGGSLEVSRVGRIAEKYLAAYRDETEKFVADGKPEALARSEAFSEVDRIASLKWLGRLHAEGKGGVKRDLSKAFSYYGQAVSAGDKTAAVVQDKLVRAMVASKEDADRQTALKYFKARALSGGPSDHYWLGEWYARSSKPLDIKEAEIWLGKALTQDDDGAVRNLAFSSLSRMKEIGATATSALDRLAPKYAKGKDEGMKTTAYVYLERRANAGDPGSALWVGFRYSEGDGVAKDEKTARQWFFKAALQDKNTEVKDRAFAALGERAPPPKSAADAGSKTRGEFAPSEAKAIPAPSAASNASPAPERTQPAPADWQSSSPITPDTARGNIDPTTKSFIIPANAAPNTYVPRGWSCKPTFRHVGNECQYIEKPANSSHNSYTPQGWSCNPTFRRVGNECQYIEKPANSSHNSYTPQGWSCNPTFRQVGNECWKVETSR